VTIFSHNVLSYVQDMDHTQFYVLDKSPADLYDQLYAQSDEEDEDVYNPSRVNRYRTAHLDDPGVDTILAQQISEIIPQGEYLVEQMLDDKSIHNVRNEASDANKNNYDPFLKSYLDSMVEKYGRYDYYKEDMSSSEFIEQMTEDETARRRLRLVRTNNSSDIDILRTDLNTARVKDIRIIPRSFKTHSDGYIYVKNTEQEYSIQKHYEWKWTLLITTYPKDLDQYSYTNSMNAGGMYMGSYPSSHYQSQIYANNGVQVTNAIPSICIVARVSLSALVQLLDCIDNIYSPTQIPRYFKHKKVKEDVQSWSSFLTNLRKVTTYTKYYLAIENQLNSYDEFDPEYYIWEDVYKRVNIRRVNEMNGVQDYFYKIVNGSKVYSDLNHMSISIFCSEGNVLAMDIHILSL